MKYFFRFNPQPPPDLPLTVRSVGESDSAAGEFTGAPAYKSFTQIFWTESGVGEFHFAKRWVRSNGIFLLFPGELHDLRPVTRWKFHWFTLDHPESRRWVEAMGLHTCPESAPPCPVKLFRALQKEVKPGTVAADRRASQIAYAILLEAGKDLLSDLPEHHSSRVEECRERIDGNFSDPFLNVAAIAQDMGLHRTTLFRAFTAAHGMPPSLYLQSRRMHHAMQLLKQSDASVKEVAAKSGYADPNYFARVLRRMCGLSPHEFRDAYRQGEPLDQNLRIRIPFPKGEAFAKRTKAR